MILNVVDVLYMYWQQAYYRCTIDRYGDPNLLRIPWGTTSLRIANTNQPLSDWVFEPDPEMPVSKPWTHEKRNEHTFRKVNKNDKPA
jgi:hypothetical protein